MQVTTCSFVTENEEGNTAFYGATVNLTNGVVDTEIEDVEAESSIVKSYIEVRGVEFAVNKNSDGQMAVDPKMLTKISDIAMRRPTL